jgi:hypothetical protein
MRKYSFLLWMGGAILLLASCSRRSYPGSEPYPNERYPNERYPVPENRPVVIYEPGRNLPPGQAKKIYGDRSARNHAPGHRKKYCPAYGQSGYPLIIIRTPDIVLGRHTDGRYYHRNRDGLFYWLMPDNRFYLDSRYMNDVQYDEHEYRSWQQAVNQGQYSYPRYDNRRGDDDNRGRGHKGKGKGKKWKHDRDDD